MPRCRPLAACFAGVSACILALAGCAAPPQRQDASTLGPAQTSAESVSYGEPMNALEQGRLRQRALDFLHRAARDEIDVVCANAIEALALVEPDGGEREFRAALNAESAMVRFAACVAIGDALDKDALERVQRLYGDPDPRVRLGAVFAAMRCGDRSRGWELVDALRHSKDDAQRRIAAQLIGRLREADSARVLRAIADDRATDSLLAVQVVAALAALGDERAVEQLCQYAQGSPPVRAVALQSMVELALPATRDALLYRFQTRDEYDENRLLAARALGRLGMKNGLDLAMRAVTRPPESRPDDPHGLMRLQTNAALALGDIGDKRALHALKQLAETSDDPRVQLAASAAICRIVDARERPEAKARP